jgi:5'-3' exonuclease
MKVVIDADQLIYAAGFASQGEPRSHTYRLLNNGIEAILEDTEVDEYEVYIGGKDNFREDVAVTQGYKANRVAPKPESYDDARQFLVDRWSASIVNGMETDDKVSILLWQDYKEHGGDPDKCQVILSSPDKDLKNTPGWHYNPQKKTLQFYTDEQSMRHFWWQVLCGDNTDNIKGLPYCAKTTREQYGLTKAAAKGCGAGSATKIMSQTSDINEAERAVVGAYIQWGLEQKLEPLDIYTYFLEQCRLLWMVRELDDFDSPLMFDYDMDLFYSYGIEELTDGLDTDSVSG